MNTHTRTHIHHVNTWDNALAYALHWKPLTLISSLPPSSSPCFLRACACSFSFLRLSASWPTRWQYCPSGGHCHCLRATRPRTLADMRSGQISMEQECSVPERWPGWMLNQGYSWFTKLLVRFKTSKCHLQPSKAEKRTPDIQADHVLKQQALHSLVSPHLRPTRLQWSCVLTTTVTGNSLPHFQGDQGLSPALPEKIHLRHWRCLMSA